jgi:DNA repair exonuclease SbcCD ATPase subunit
MFAKKPRAIGALALFCLVAFQTQAVPKEGASDAQIQQTLRKAQGMLRQINEEKNALAAKNAELQTRIDALETRVKQLEPLENEVSKQKAGLDALNGQNESLRQRVEGDGERLRNLSERQRQSLEKLKKTQQDNRLLIDAVSERERWIEECGQKNRGLVEADRAMLERFAERDWWDSFKNLEPVTGIGQVARENAAQEYTFKLEELQVTPWKAPEGEGQAQSPNQPKAEMDDEEDEDP